ncbi:MAG TPA: hypothetical protein VK939_05060 [Longimicrobiales bacterium]|nr:hypothetical protein [Longimicrobiales bacterium]
MTLLFWIALVLGGGLALLSMLGDVFGDVFGHPAEGDIDHDGLHIISLRSGTYFLFAFGAVGVLLDWAWDGRLTLMAMLAALATGAGAALFSAYVFRWVRRTDSGAMPDDRTLTGLAGEVVLPLRQGSGKIVVRRGGREYELMARPFGEAESAETWTRVVVVDVVDGTALVSPYGELETDLLPPSNPSRGAAHE